MKKCPYCGAQIADDSLFCTECGKELPKGTICPHCGASVNEGDTFCTECGKRIDEVNQATSSVPTKPKCPHCGASINEGDVFCMECGKKVNELQPTETEEVIATKERIKEASVDNIIETPQTEEQEEVEYHYDIEEEPKTWRDYKLPIFGGIFLVLFLGACWWYYDSSNQRVAMEKTIADSLEMVRIDSMKKAEAKIEAERQEAEQKKREEEAEQFCKQFSVDNLICLINNYEDSKKAETSGLSFIYKDAVHGGEYGDDIEIVYGKCIEKGDKRNLGYYFKGTTNHSCYFQVNLDTSTQMSIGFSIEDDANNFYNKVSKYGVIEYEGTYYIPKKKLQNEEPIHVDELEWEGEYTPLYIVSPPEFKEGFYMLYTGFCM